MRARTAACLAVALVVGLAMPASAVEPPVRPSGAPTVDPQGNQNGCEGSMAAWAEDADGETYVVSDVSAFCPFVAPRMRITHKWQVVRPDGARGKVFLLGSVLDRDRPAVGGGYQRFFLPCAEHPNRYLSGQTYQLIGRGTVIERDSYDRSGAPNRAVVEDLVTFTCA